MPLPQMKRGSGTVLGTYRIGPYTSMLIRDAESAGPIKYFYMLSVTAQGGTSPAIVVTLEHNEMQAELLRTAAQNMDEETRKALLANAPKSYLCMFDKNGGHQILEQLPQVLSEEQFRERAFTVVARELRIADTPSRIDPEASSPSVSAAASPKWPIVVTLVALGLVVLFPPYTDHFVTARAGEISGHGGWKFLFEIGQYNTRTQTESISIGLWFLEVMVVAGAGGVLWWLTRNR